jgi:hypothetical protein
VPDELRGKERRRELYGEVIRDVGILALVFAPLDILISKPAWIGGRILMIVTAAVAVIIFGVHQDPRGRSK